jgi:hypothetical protein
MAMVYKLRESLAEFVPDKDQMMMGAMSPASLYSIGGRGMKCYPGKEMRKSNVVVEMRECQRGVR